MDYVIVEKELDENTCACEIATWHDDDPLRETIEFFLSASDTADVAVVLSVGTHFQSQVAREVARLRG